MELLFLTFYFVVMFQDYKGQRLAAEVAVMLKLGNGKEGSVGTSAPVSLLDWYNTDEELILVLERPVPSEDLFEYINNKEDDLDEKEAKVSCWRIFVKMHVFKAFSTTGV